MIQRYFRTLYQRTMDEAHALAFKEIAKTLIDNGHCLDCGANNGNSFYKINEIINFNRSRYHGIEWNRSAVNEARTNNLNVIEGDLNRILPFENERFRCIFGLSVLEHLLNGCLFMNECHRLLERGAY